MVHNTNLAADPLRVETLALLEQSAARFSDLVQALTEAEWAATPAGEDWSLAQISEHITLVEVGSGKLIARKLYLQPATSELLAEANGKDALLRTIAAAQITGIRAVLLRAMSDDAKRFYARAGFHECPVDPMMMMMITLAEVEKNLSPPSAR